MVALTLDAEELRLDGDGQVVEWLVKMRRLPRHLMLDRAIQEARVTEQDVVRFTCVLGAFYRDAEPVRVAPAAYRKRLRTAILANDAALAAPHFGFDRVALKALADAQLALIERAAPEIDKRVRQARIVEGHGDLRPEHVCLAAEPIFIDCLEFDRDLRLLDPVDELAYLAMECELAGALWIGPVVFDTYRSVTGDAPSAALVGCYQGLRATLRAKLAAWHLEDGVGNSARARWLARAQAYLDLARLCCDRGAAASGKAPAARP